MRKPKKGTVMPAITRRAFTGALAASAAIGMVPNGVYAKDIVKAKNVVLVHGLFADGSCWSEVIPHLLAAGLNVTSVQNPLTTLLDAVASAKRVLDRQHGPTVLVGHSFSGMIVSGPGVHSNVSAVVYIAARAPDAGDYAGLAKTYPTPPASAGIVFDGDEGRLTEEAFLRDFAGDVPKEKARVLYAVQEPFHKELLAGKTTVAAWRSKPSFYAVSKNDRTIDPDLERFMAKRMDATTIELNSSHVSMISQPKAVSNLILEARAHRSDPLQPLPPQMNRRWITTVHRSRESADEHATAPACIRFCSVFYGDGRIRGLDLSGKNAVVTGGSSVTVWRLSARSHLQVPHYGAHAGREEGGRSTCRRGHP
jgi:pimeloyl-ACP methyl ester carboxylesterase